MKLYLFKEKGKNFGTSEHTQFLDQTKGFLITTLPTILFALVVIYFLTRKTKVNHT